MKSTPSFTLHLRKTASVALSALALSACGLGGGEGESVIPRQEAQTALASDVLPGSWSSECMKNGVTGAFEKWKFDFSRDSDDWSLTLRQESYTIVDCQGDPVARDVELSQGEFSRGLPAVLNLDPFSAISLVLDEGLAQARNGERHCDRDDWTVGVAIELTGTACEPTRLAARTIVTQTASAHQIQITTCQANECQSLKLVRTSP